MKHGHHDQCNNGLRTGTCGCRDGHPKIMGFLIPCMLQELLSAPAHGYSLMEKLNKQPYISELPDKAIIYRHLRKLEEEGMVTSSFEQGGGPARKVYTITDEGRSCLDSWIKGLHELHAFLGSFLKHE